MKTVASVFLGLAGFGLWPIATLSTFAAEGTNTHALIGGSQPATEARSAPQEALGYDIVNGRTNKIIRVSKATPAWLYVIYEGGLAGRKIPRQDLPPQLQDKYPYDAEKADAYRKQEAEQEARRSAS